MNIDFFESHTRPKHWALHVEDYEHQFYLFLTPEDAKKLFEKMKDAGF
jgi:hypothetical protein